MPVQRIPRYELLLRDLRRATADDHKDAQLITEALSRVEAVNRAVNEKMRRADQARKISELSAQVSERFMTCMYILFCSHVRVCAIYSSSPIRSWCFLFGSL